MQIAQIHCTYFTWLEPEAVNFPFMTANENRWILLKNFHALYWVWIPQRYHSYRPKCWFFWGEKKWSLIQWVTIFISTSERKLCPKQITKVRTWKGHNQKMVGGTRSCTGRAWWTGRGWARAFPGRSYSIWKLWRPWPQEHCNTSQPSTGSTWMYGAEGYWCLGGWERRRSPS